ncbi:hypothetical protein GCM10008908_21660 [Clostridium subterminale]|uniref:Uncharacterized protein n=1 Tax=Clostridium subterminale TaxID=1550 RepID=A0ABN1KQF0_CLOSU
MEKPITNAAKIAYKVYIIFIPPMYLNKIKKTYILISEYKSRLLILNQNIQYPVC